MKKRVIRGMVAASVTAAIVGSCIFMTSTNGHGGVDVNAASVKAESVVSESVEIPSEYPSEAVYLHFKADLQKQKDGQDAWKKAQAEKKAAEDKKKADEELAAKEQAANDAMRAVWNFEEARLQDGATRDMLADAQAKIEALPEGNATRDALTPAIFAADNAFTVIENQQKATEEQSQQTQQSQQAVQAQSTQQAVSYTNTVPATSFGVQDNFNQSFIDELSPALQSVAWNIISACENNQSGLVYVGTVDYNEDWYKLDNFGAVYDYFGINDGYSLCDKDSSGAFNINDDGQTLDLYILGGDTAYNAIQAKRNKIVYYQQLLGNVPTDDAGKVAAINARICGLLTYDWSYTIHDPDEAVNAGTGVCEAYALLFHRMAESVGLQDRLCVGPANGGSHEWNQTLVNGQWLYTDTTWNDCAGQNLYFMSPSLWSDHGFDYYDGDNM